MAHMMKKDLELAKSFSIKTDDEHRQVLKRMRDIKKLDEECPNTNTAFATLRLICDEQSKFIGFKEDTSKKLFNQKIIRFGNGHEELKSDTPKRTIEVLKDADCDVNGTEHKEGETDNKEEATNCINKKRRFCNQV